MIQRIALRDVRRIRRETETIFGERGTPAIRVARNGVSEFRWRDNPAFNAICVLQRGGRGFGTGRNYRNEAVFCDDDGRTPRL